MDLPRQKLVKLGAEALSDTELLALILRTGFRTKRERQSVLELSYHLLNTTGGLKKLLTQTHLDDLKQKGLGPVKTSTLYGLREMFKRVLREETTAGHCHSSVEAFHYFRSLLTLNQEHLDILIMDTQGVVLKKKNLFKGTINFSVVSTREIIAEVLKQNGTKFILAHNHPSGHLMPSSQDIQFTKSLRSLCKTLQMQLEDHLILGHGLKFYSFRSESVISA